MFLKFYIVKQFVVPHRYYVFTASEALRDVNYSNTSNFNQVRHIRMAKLFLAIMASLMRFLAAREGSNTVSYFISDSRVQTAAKKS